MKYRRPRRNRQTAFRKPPLRKRKPTYHEPPPPDFQRLNGNQHDALYKEVLKSVKYNWHLLEPLGDNYSSDTSSSKGVVLLKALCALELAKNANQIEPLHLDLAPWSCWELVWNNILSLSHDSIYLVGIFASKFRKEPGFQCHISETAGSIQNRYNGERSLNLARYESINACMIPWAKNHRIENLFLNINFQHFTNHIYKLHYKPWILLDLSEVTKNLENEDYYKVVNIPNLVALDLSNSSFVDDHFLYHLANVIKSDSKLKQLTLLRLNKCPKITKKGLRYLFEVSKDSFFASSLSYIESDLKIVPSKNFTQQFNVSREEDESIDYIDNTRWKLLPEEDLMTKLVARVPIGLKLHLLYKKFGKFIIKRSVKEENDELYPYDTTNTLNYLYKSKDTIIFDFMLHNEEFTVSDYGNITGKEKLEKSWKRRLTVRNKLASRLQYNYIANHNYTPIVKEVPKYTSKTEVKEIEAPISRAGTKKRAPTTSTKANKKPRKIITNVSSFFNM